jgi:hypothetical protein
MVDALSCLSASDESSGVLDQIPNATYFYSNQHVARNSRLLTNMRFFCFVHTRIETEIDFKNLIPCITIRQVVQTRLRPDFSTMHILGKNSCNPLRNA